MNDTKNINKLNIFKNNVNKINDKKNINKLNNFKNNDNNEYNIYINTINTNNTKDMNKNKLLYKQSINTSSKIDNKFKGIVRLNSKYSINQELKPGNFGKILLALNKQTNKYVVMKITPPHNKMLIKEAKIYIFLQEKNFGITPEYYEYKESKKHDIMITEYYGHDLSYWKDQQTYLNEYYDNYFTHFDLNTSLIILYGLIKIIQILHHYNVIYHDIKPENFLIDDISNLTFDNINQHLKIIDFGLAEKLTKEQLQQTDYVVKNERGMISGTLRYCSKNAYNGYEQTYKDDFESIIYLIVYLYKGYLPWQSNLGEKKKNKESLNPEDFIPDELSFLRELYKQNFNLQFNEKMDYTNILRTIRKIYMMNNKKE